MASKLTDLKTKTMERKQILEVLTGHCAGVASTKENGLVATTVYLDDLADELVNLFAIHSVVDSSVTISKQEYDALKRDSEDLRKIDFSM